LYAAYTVNRPLRHVKTRPGAAFSRSNELIIRRWADSRWVVDGELRGTVEPKYGFVNYPDSGIGVDEIYGVDSEAPNFSGREGGVGGYGFMVAVRSQGRWRWARFIGCLVASPCRPRLPQDTVVGDGWLKHHRLTSDANDCTPSCPIGQQYLDHWVWSGDTAAFVIARRDDLPRGHDYTPKDRRLIRRYVTRHHLPR
jgi:hypothetical protein